MSESVAHTVATLWRYPVKSMLGEELNGAEFTLKGVLGDRLYALIDAETNKVVSAKNPKKWPDFFAYRAAFAELPQAGQLPPVWVTIPDGTVLRTDHADINEKLSQALGRKVSVQSKVPASAQLEQYWPEYAGAANEVSDEGVAGDAPAGTFFDYAAVHLLTTSSLAALQALYPEGRIEARRFRPNVVIDTHGLPGFVENAWVGKVLRLGVSLRLQVTDPCPRCVMPTLAQGDLPQDPGILKHAVAKNLPLVPFAGKALPSAGIYAKVLQPGWVKRGDVLTVEA